MQCVQVNSSYIGMYMVYMSQDVAFMPKANIKKCQKLWSDPNCINMCSCQVQCVCALAASSAGLYLCAGSGKMPNTAAGPFGCSGSRT